MFHNIKVTHPEVISYEGKDSDEQIIFVLRKSIITLIPPLFLVALLLVIPLFATPFLFGLSYKGIQLFNAMFIFSITLFWYLFTFGILFQVLLHWYYNLFIVTTKKIVDMDFMGLSYSNISETTVRNIEDVTSKVTGLMGVVFNIGTVSIQTAAEMREFEMTELDNPSEIRDNLSDMVANYKNHDRR